MTFPATRVVHWPSGPVPCCDRHAHELRGLASFLGTYLGPDTMPAAGVECTNCVNASKDAEGSA